MLSPRWHTLLLAHVVGRAVGTGAVEDFTSLIQQRVGPEPVDHPSLSEDLPAGPAPEGRSVPDPFASTSWEYPFNNVTLDGGYPPWKLFEEGAPGERKNVKYRRKEMFRSPTNTNPIAFLCCPSEGGDIKWFVSVTEPALVPFYVPFRATPPFRKSAAVIIAPGGGFTFLDWFKEGTHIAKWLNGMGIHAFVLKYRIPDPTASKSVEDAQRAITLVRSRARYFGIDEDKIGFMGFSAGGTIAAEVGYAGRRYYNETELVNVDFKPNFVLLLYAIANPLRAAYSVPTFIAVAATDTCVSPSSVASYHQRLRKGGVRSEMHMFGQGGHGFGDCTMYVVGKLTTRSACGWTANAEEWLYSEVLKSHPPLQWQFTGLRRM